MHHHILGIGAAFVDLTAHVEDSFLDTYRLEKGSVSFVEASYLDALIQATQGYSSYAPGGSGANVIRALARLGWPCSLIGTIGNDSAAAFLLNDLNAQRIETHYFKTSFPTAKALCLVTPDGERTMCDLLGASTLMQSGYLDFSHFHGKTLVHLEGYTLCNGDLPERTVQLAVETNTLVSFDLANYTLVQAHRSRLLDLIKTKIDILFGNVHEVTTLLQMTPEQACSTLSTFCKYVVVTLGKEGCLIGHQQQVIALPAYSIKTVVDTTGAGDLFAAGFLDGILNNKNLEVCGLQGAYLAAHVISRQGASLPAEKWVDILSDWKFRFP